MANKTSKTETKRLPKGQRTHIRRIKQAARKEVGASNLGAARASTKEAGTGLKR